MLRTGTLPDKERRYKFWRALTTILLVTHNSKAPPYLPAFQLHNGPILSREAEETDDESRGFGIHRRYPLPL
jgi:hypothetical protein